ncbi:MAG TPA: YtxH domain-containing protein [Aggregatilineales bacterium]|nr:YtxH domain-containing protein [Aggregatilineales bacterium]
MNKFLSFLAGMVLGALIGAGVALLFAPMSGQDLRSSAQSRAQRTVDEVRSAVAEERRRLETELEALKHGEIKIS